MQHHLHFTPLLSVTQSELHGAPFGCENDGAMGVGQTNRETADRQTDIC